MPALVREWIPRNSRTFNLRSFRSQSQDAPCTVCPYGFYHQPLRWGKRQTHLTGALSKSGVGWDCCRGLGGEALCSVSDGFTVGAQVALATRRGQPSAAQEAHRQAAMVVLQDMSVFAEPVIPPERRNHRPPAPTIAGRPAAGLLPTDPSGNAGVSVFPTPGLLSSQVRHPKPQSTDKMREASW